MITKLAWFAMMPVILFASHSSFSAEEPIVPAHDEPIQPIPVDATLNPDKIELGEFLFNDPRLSKDNSLSCASCHILDAGGDDNLVTGIALGVLAHVMTRDSSPADTSSTLSAALRQVSEHYVEEISEEELLSHAIDGMMQSCNACHSKLPQGTVPSVWQGMKG